MRTFEIECRDAANAVYFQRKNFRKLSRKTSKHKKFLTCKYETVDSCEVVDIMDDKESKEVLHEYAYKSSVICGTTDSK